MSQRILPPRPVSIANPLPQPPEIPPVPKRRQSLEINRGDTLRSSLKKPLMLAGMAAIEPLIEDPTTGSYTFEAKSLWKDSFKALYDFYQQGQLCDVELKVGTKTINCHRVVLACVSRYFKVMFTSEMAESRNKSVSIKDIDEKAMELLVNFAYTSKITLTIENVQPLLYASSILQLETVAYACCDFMKTHLHPSNCIGIRTFAEQHGRNELMKIADQYIYDNFSGVVESDEFFTMTPKHLDAIVSSEDLNVDSETHVYEAVMRWVKHKTDDRKKYLATLIPKVKLPLLPASYLMENVEREDLLKRDLDCRDYLDEAKYYQMSLSGIVGLEVKPSTRTRPRKSYAGVIFCVGGRGASGDPFKSIECYDLRRNKWFQVAEMSTRRRHVGVVAIKGKLYGIGGHDGTDHLATGEVFDPKTNKWKAIACMNTLRRGIALACLGGPIYAVGGLDDTTCYNVVERYDITSDVWNYVAQMNMPRGGVGLAPLKGFLYAIGGNDGTASLDTCERYDPHLNKWNMIATMNKRRAGSGVAELNGYLYVVGGFDDNSPLDSVERYDPKTNTWTMVGHMSCARGGVGVASLGGKIYAVGGHDGTNYLNSVEAYDPLMDSWEAVKGTTLCRAGAGVCSCEIPTRMIKEVMCINVDI